MSELSDFQKWCKEILPVVQAAADGCHVEYFTGGEWHEKTASTSLHRETKYRIKPRTIKVNGFDVPESMREAPKLGVTYFIPSVAADDFYVAEPWHEEEFDYSRLSRCVCHATKEAAIAHAKAMLGIDPNGGDE